MTRKFKTPDYEAMLHSTVSLADALPEGHLARFVVEVIAQLDLGSIYSRYAPVGGEAIAPEILLGLLFYGYATGIFSSRKIERATHESLPFRFIASGLHPDHDTIATFRKTFLAEIQELFVQLLLLAQAVGVLQLGNISLDGSKIHADASKSKAVSYKRLGELETQLRQEVRQLLTLGEQVDRADTLSHIYSFLAGAFQHLTQFDQSQAWARQSMALGERKDYPSAIAMGYEFLAEDAVETLDRLGSRVELGRALYQRGLLRRTLGEAAAARDDLRRALELFEVCGAAPDRDRVARSLA